MDEKHGPRLVRGRLAWPQAGLEDLEYARSGDGLCMWMQGVSPDTQ